MSGDGTIAVPQEPGLGLNIDLKKLKRYGTRFYKGSRLSIAVNTIRQKGLKTALEIKKKKKAAAKKKA